MNNHKFKVGDKVMFTPKTAGSAPLSLDISAVYYADEGFAGTRTSDGSIYVGYVYGAVGTSDVYVETSLSIAN